MEIKYVCGIDEEYHTVTVGSFPSKCNWFYNYEHPRLISSENLEKVKIGQKAFVKLTPYYKHIIVLTDSTPIKEIVDAKEKRDAFYTKLYEKYGDSFDYKRSPEFERYLNICFNEMVKHGKQLDTYTANATYIVCKVFNIRVRANRTENPEDLAGFYYPESMFEVVNAIYDIINEMVMNNGMSFNMQYTAGMSRYDLPIGNSDYNAFVKELESRTHFKNGGIEPEVYVLRDATCYRGYGDHNEFCDVNSVLNITPELTEYIYDTNDPNSKRLYIKNSEGYEHSGIYMNWNFEIKGNQKRKV